MGIFSFTDHVVFQAENRVRPVERSASTRLRAHNVVRTFLASAHPFCAGNFTTCVVSCLLQTFSNLVGNVTTTFAGIASSMLKRTRCPDKRGGAPMGGATRLIEHVRWHIATRQASGSAQVEFSFHFFAGSLEEEKAAMRLWLSMLSSAAATRSPVSGGGSCERRQCCDQFVSAQSCWAPLYTDLV